MAAINKNFVVKNGIEVGDNLIFGNKDQLRVGIGTTVPNYTLDVRGGIGATSVSVGQTLTANSGIITTLQPSKISVGGTTGVTGQYLKSTGTGLEWASFPTARTSSTFTATEGQTSFSFAYTVGLVDVFVNGVRLTDVEFTATDGLTVVLGTSCRVGDIVDIIGYAITGIGAGTSGIGGISVLDEGIVIGNNSAVTSINFVGASVTSTGTGAGVTVTISSPNTGYADTAGISTVSSGLTTTANINTSGIATISRVIVGSGTTFTEKLVVVGDARITGILTIGTASVTIDGSTNTLTVPNLVVTNSTSGVTVSGVGITVRDGGGNLGSAEIIDFGDNLSVSFSAGIATITGSAAGAGGTWASNSVGIYTSRNVGIGTTNPGEKLQVDGNIRVGISSTSNYISFKGTYRDGNPQPDTPEFKPYEHTYIGERIYDYSGLGEKSELLLYKGNDLSNTPWGPDRIRLLSFEHKFDILQSTTTGSFEDVGLSTATNVVTINSSGVGIGTTNPTSSLTVKGNTSLETLNVSGVSTLGVVTAGNIYSTGIITATTFVGNFSGSITDATNLTGGTANASSLNVSGITTISQGRIQADASSNLRFGNLPAGSGSGRNIAIGDQVLASLSGGSGRNIGIGELSYYDTTTGQYNIGIGERAGQKVSTGSYNVILGAYDGNSGNLDIRTSSNNVVIADGQGNIRQYINSSGNVGIKTTVVTEALTVAGVVSATSFYGTLNAGQLIGTLPAIDGSALLNVVGSGSGVEVQEDGTPVGTAGTINFGNNVSVSFAAGIATVSGASSVSAATTAYNLAGTPNLTVGVVTATRLNVTEDLLVLPRGTSKGIHFGVPPYDDLANDSVIFVSDSADPSNGRLILNSGNYFTRFVGSGIEYVRDGLTYTSISSITSYIGGFSDASRVGIGSTQPTSKLDVSGDAKVSGVVTASSFSGSGSGLTNLPSGQLTGALPALDGSALLNVTAAGTGIAIRDDNTPVGSAVTVNFGTGLDVTFNSGIATVTASGGSLQSRTTVSGVTTSIANNGIGNTNITGFKSYALMKVGLSTAAWLRLYTDSTSRSNDASRSVGIDPAPGSGVIAEVVTTGISTTQIISPFVMGGNLNNPADTTIYAAITNLSGSTQAITANLTILQLEA